ncbi:ral guanine nucleotide dissociation stimulator-like [Myotis daubentonii]|uniref:ral guanine nucleotide dissociation stimulator-like n=1 Tax=Myotis daubentonii TaxID=98922 RepID=UPI0028737CC7|nr:ral guanine nucleotide dissociation stimulator-like [Myotis daubentonii]
MGGQSGRKDQESDSAAHLPLPRATASVMGTRLDQVQYLGQPLLSPWFLLKQALVLHSRPAPHPVGFVRSLWVELAHLEPTEAQGEEPPPELKRTPEPEEGPAPGLEPGPAVGVLEPSGPPALIRIPTAEPAPPPTTDYPRAGTPKHLIREEKVNTLTFPPRLVAEQLTAMDAELFKKVLPHQCRGSVWSQRAKPGKEHVASTVSATVRQFNRVATCVITTCLGDPSMMARDRANVVEHWMKVAKECRILRNFSSLHAILAALQSMAVHRLKKTWGKVSRCVGLSHQRRHGEVSPKCLPLSPHLLGGSQPWGHGLGWWAG